MSISIEVSSSDWVDLRTRGFSGTMYLLNAVGAPLEYSIAASPVAGAYLTGSAGVSIPGPYLWVRGAGTAELFTPSEWAAYNTKTYPVTASTPAQGVASAWDLQTPSLAGAVVYSALPKLNNYLRADGKVYSISAYPGLARRLGRVCNGISAFATRTTTNDRSWRSVCWSPERMLFVAVAYSGTGNRVMTSPDGINWTQRASAADNVWRSVCWSPERMLFVAVAETGAGNRVMTSPDGIVWTSQTSAVDNGWRSVCWSPDLLLFVAVASSGTGNRVMTSPDGINWTSRTSAMDNAWRNVCWTGVLGLFVAVSSDGTGNRVMTSPDGIVWTSRTSAVDNAWQSVCWSRELSMIVSVSSGGAGNRVMTAYGCTYNPLTDFAVPKITAPAGCYAHIFAG